MGAATSGYEAAPHPPREEDGDGDVAAGRDTSLFAIGDDGADVEEVGDDNYDDVAAQMLQKYSGGRRGARTQSARWTS